jgi:hypothetical protein
LARRKNEGHRGAPEAATAEAMQRVSAGSSLTKWLRKIVGGTSLGDKRRRRRLKRAKSSERAREL